MTRMTLKELAEKLRDLDIAMLSTHTDGGQIAGRPMSNNRDVEYDGDSYYFTLEHTRTVRDIQRDPKVGLAFQGSRGLLGKPPLHIAVEGDAELIRDRAQFEAHWTKDLEIWFRDGIDTPDLVLIKVHATRIHYWNGEDEGEIALPAGGARRPASPAA